LKNTIIFNNPHPKQPERTNGVEINEWKISKKGITGMINVTNLFSFQIILFTIEISNLLFSLLNTL